MPTSVVAHSLAPQRPVEQEEDARVILRLAKQRLEKQEKVVCRVFAADGYLDG
jgi:hypothetical protein